MVIVGLVDTESTQVEVLYLNVNTDENYIYSRKLAKYAELNQDMYLWIWQRAKLEDYYYNDEGKIIDYTVRSVVEGKKIERAELPALNLILKSINIGSYKNSTDNFTYINFNFPTVVENRKFTLKIGKVTDTNILNKIKNNDYSGIKELLTYAKNNKAVYSKNLTTTKEAYYRSDDALFDGRSLLKSKDYYYIYAVFDDENGKYYPIEGVTLGQAYLSESSTYWDLWAYTSSDFKWDNLTPTSSPSGNTPTELPYTGLNIFLMAGIMGITVLMIIVFYKKNKYYKGI